jgi:hypothetical protein
VTATVQETTVPDPRTDRIADLAAALDALDPPAVRLARRLYTTARADLLALARRGAGEDLIQAHRYRADRAHDRLVDAWRTACA